MRWAVTPRAEASTKSAVEQGAGNGQKPVFNLTTVNACAYVDRASTSSLLGARISKKFVNIIG